MAYGQAVTQGYSNPSLVVANKVIVFGPNQGVFVYNGTPAAGNLEISIAATAGTDNFGNSYPSGLSVGESGDAAQVQLIPSTGHQSAEITFPVPSLGLSNVPNMAGGLVSGTPNYADLVISGPALNTAGIKDWVQIALFSNNGAGIDGHAEDRYINTSGVVTVLCRYGASGYLFFQQVEINANLFVDGLFTSDAGTIFSDGAGNLTIGNSFTLTPKMATPPNTAAVKAGTATLAQTEACLGGLIQSMQNRGMIT